MRIVIAGGHGKIALIMIERLAAAGHEAVGIIRNPDHAAELVALGGIPLVLDLEAIGAEELARDLAGADAVVFAAGAGPGSGAARKLTVDRDGAILLAEAAERAGIRRYVMISAHRTDDFDADSDDVFQVYLRAKSEADADLRGRDLDWTVIRPGGLTDEPGAGLVTLGEQTERGQVPRADVAAVIIEVLITGHGVRRQLELITGLTPVAEAVAAF
ncbi:NAD(P)H-binding protein [Microlunatus sp. GCM10028923]|uniref:NAD(P)H-binding protein n=1 Tax=Microlunatus sp. GCM10028923 TaxID=3273400 RepID=UPI00360BC61E